MTRPETHPELQGSDPSVIDVVTALEDEAIAAEEALHQELAREAAEALANKQPPAEA